MNDVVLFNIKNNANDDTGTVSFYVYATPAHNEMTIIEKHITGNYDVNCDVCTESKPEIMEDNGNVSGYIVSYTAKDDVMKCVVNDEKRLISCKNGSNVIKPEVDISEIVSSFGNSRLKDICKWGGW